ncbi:MAG: hypothetical protein OXU23_13120, partial [Candidatus Poribacteria bacterium]|nr:hypothetical protein [Candidatus Poribacteria bacterium]
LFSFKNYRLIDFTESIYCSPNQRSMRFWHAAGRAQRNPTGSHCHTKIVGCRCALPDLQCD